MNGTIVVIKLTITDVNGEEGATEDDFYSVFAVTKNISTDETSYCVKTYAGEYFAHSEDGYPSMSGGGQ